MNLKQFARHAAKMKVHKMPDPPKEKKGKGAAAAPSAYDPTEYMKRKPRLGLNTMQFPVVKDWKVGEEYTLVTKVKMTGYNQDEYMKGEAEASFEVLEIGVMPHGDKK